MMKIAAYIIVVFFLFPFKGQCETSSQQTDSISAQFRQFLAGFTDYDGKDINPSTFDDSVSYQMIDKDKYGMFLSESDNCDCSAMYWQQGHFYKRRMS